VTISNWGWNFAASSPVSDVRDLVTPTTRRRHYATMRGHAVSAAVSSANATGLFGRALRRALFDRVNRQLQMGMLVEQDPVASNRVSLAKQKDPLGLARPEIHYDLSDYVKKGIATSVRAARQMFGRLSATDETAYAEDDPQSFWFEGQHYAWRGAGHLMGTHRMGRSARDSVVDADGRCWRQKNLFLAGAGNMPTVGTSNPTLTLAALAFRTADAIVRELRSSR
jgi:choline dehydrogenase-like flavoprotein